MTAISIETAKEFFDRICAENLGTVTQNEADTRLRLIDRILIEVLGWSRSEINCEHTNHAGYTDYLMKIGETPSFVVEAKKAGAILADTINPSGKCYKISGPALKAASTAFSQAASYCLEYGVDFAALSTGVAWIGFIAFTPGRPYRDGLAYVFPNLDAIASNFAAFFDLFSRAGVKERLYKIRMANAEGFAIKSAESFVQVIQPREIRLLKKNQMASDLDPLFREFFGALSGDNDQEMLLSCFVETPESRLADEALQKLLRSISTEIRPIETETGERIAKEIQQILETRHGETIIVVGNKGAGKSTFVSRFFRVSLAADLREKCRLIQIDLLKFNGDIDALPKWLAITAKESLENSLFLEGTPTFDELRGIYYSEYQRWQRGHYAPLYREDVKGFDIKFGEYLHNQINDDPYNYVRKLIDFVVKSRIEIPCIVLDNADHFPERFQEAAFQWAQSIREQIQCSVVFFPITDRTIWRLSKDGPLQTYRSKMFYLPVPSTRSVLEKRIAYLRNKATGQRDQRSYFLEKGIRLSVENIRAFAACAEETFLNLQWVARRVGWLANHDIRRSLLISQQIMTSPYFSIDDLVAAYLADGQAGALKVDYGRFMQALVQGDYSSFSKENSAFVANLFEVDANFPSTPLLRLSLIKLLIDQAGENRELGGYTSTQQIISYFNSMGVSDEAVRANLAALLQARLIEPYDASAESIDEADRFAVSHSGRMHYEMATTDRIYIGQMAFATPLDSLVAVDRLRKLKAARGHRDWVEVRRNFITYCMGKDRKLVRLPKDNMYDGQRQLRSSLQKAWIPIAAGSPNRQEDGVPSDVTSTDVVGKYAIDAKVKFFDEPKGFGFFESADLGDLYVNKRVVRSYGLQTLLAGARVVCDVAPSAKGGYLVTHIQSVFS